MVPVFIKLLPPSFDLLLAKPKHYQYWEFMPLKSSNLALDKSTLRRIPARKKLNDVNVFAVQRLANKRSNLGHRDKESNLSTEIFG
jgi:hypothetical protein